MIQTSAVGNDRAMRGRASVAGSDRAMRGRARTPAAPQRTPNAVYVDLSLRSARSALPTVLRPFLVVALALMVFACAGCISSRGGVERQSELWTIGKTTRQDVVKRWGSPDAVLGDTWVWRSRRAEGGQLKASFMMIGATVRNMTYSTCEHRLTFRPDGTLLDEEVVNYTPGHDEWSINPWD